MGGKIFKFLLLILFILLIFSIGSFFFGSRTSFSDKGVKVEIEGPEQISVGDEVVYKIKYENNTNVSLHDLRFLFFYPEDSIVVKEGHVSGDLTEKFTVDELLSNESGEIEFRAFLIGDKGDSKKAKVSLSFKAGSLKSSFEKSGEITTNIVDLPLVLALVAPPNTVSGQNLTYILDYRNESGSDVFNLRFELTYPDGFTPQSFSTGPIRDSNNTWEVNFLKDGGGSRISITGILVGDEGDIKPVSVKMKRKIEGEYLDYVKATSSTTISNPLLDTNILVNNSIDYSAYLGDSLNYTIKYENQSTYDLTGLNMIAKLEGDMFDFATLNTKGGFFDNSTQTILWNSSTVSDFSKLIGSSRGQVEFSIDLKDQFPSGLPGSSRDRLVKVSTDLTTPNVPSEISASEISAKNSNVVKISSQPNFNQIAYYNDPSQGSSGPFPPKVDNDTNFTIHWQVSNPGNDIADAKIIATLPQNVIWTGVASATNSKSTPIYNIDTLEVSWAIEDLPYGIGVLTPKYEATFQIKIRPTVADIGSVITLLKNIKFSGNDNFTKQSIIITSDDLDTNGLFDRPNQGIVSE